MKPDGVCTTTSPATFCPDGTYPNSTNNICTTCPEQCSKCNSAVDCTACSGTYQLTVYQPSPSLSFCYCQSGQFYHSITKICVASCPTIGFYSDTNLRICFPCHISCETCSNSGSTNCTTCNVNLFKQLSTCAAGTCTCLSTCPSGTWKNSAV